MVSCGCAQKVEVATAWAEVEVMAGVPEEAEEVREKEMSNLVVAASQAVALAVAMDEAAPSDSAPAPSSVFVYQRKRWRHTEAAAPQGKCSPCLSCPAAAWGASAAS